MTGTTETKQATESTGLSAMRGMIGRAGLTSVIEMTVTKKASGLTGTIALSEMIGTKGLKGTNDLRGSRDRRETTGMTSVEM